MSTLLTSNWQHSITKEKEEYSRNMYLPVFEHALGQWPDIWRAEDVICIGGAKTYELCLPYCSSLFLTEWDFEVEGDTVMPPFEHLFPVRRKIKEIEDGDGIIWEYMTKEKAEQEYPFINID